MSHSKSSGLIAYFVKHPLASQLMMFVVLILGGFATFSLNSQLLPSFHVPVIFAEGVWTGASAKIIDQLAIIPIEQVLKQGNDVVHSESRAMPGMFRMGVEYQVGTDVNHVLQQKRDEIAQLESIPDGVQKLKLYTLENDDLVAHVMVTGLDHPKAYRYWAQYIEQQLANLEDVSKVYVSGVPSQELVFNIPIEKLVQYKLSLNDIRDQLTANLGSWPLGHRQVEEKDIAFKLDNQFNHPEAILDAVLLNSQGNPLYFKDLVSEAPVAEEQLDHLVYFNGQPALDFEIRRSAKDDALTAANSLRRWVDDANKHLLDLPDHLSISMTQENWKLIKDRMSVLIKNAIQGFALVIISLLIFMRFRMASWVALGIPIAFSVALFVLYCIGISLNMLTLFSFIMMLGLVVDDTIVVAEQAYHEFESGLNPTDAVLTALKKIGVPVLAATLTTVFAFIPLLSLKSLMGQVLIVIPIVAIAVLIGSLLECFFILPHHLKHSLLFSTKKTNQWHARAGQCFEWFYNNIGHPMLVMIVRYRYWSLSLVMMIFVAFIIFIHLAHIPFKFFPSPPGNVLYVDQVFDSELSDDLIKQHVDTLSNYLANRSDVEYTITHFNEASPATTGNVVRYKVTMPKSSYIVLGISEQAISRQGSDAIIRDIRDSLPDFPGRLEYQINPINMGPPGKEIMISLVSEEIDQLYLAAQDVIQYLSGLPSVYNIESKIKKYKRTVFNLKDAFKSRGLTQVSLANQMNVAINGTKVDLVDHPFILRSDVDDLPHLMQYPIKLNQSWYPLSEVVDVEYEDVFSMLPRQGGERIINVHASIDDELAYPNRLRQQINDYIERNITPKHHVKLSTLGQARYEKSAIPDLIQGFWIAVFLIYITIAWAIRSYWLPLLVMATIPFSLIGAVCGHLLLGVSMTFLSLFSLFGLSGVVINTSILLVIEINRHAQTAKSWHEAIITACGRRMRPIVLTSITTVLGLLPLLFSHSFSVLFLKPMVISILFGMLFSSMIAIVLIPSLMAIIPDKWIKHGI